MASNSTGVNRPRAACQRHRWSVRLIQVTIAIRSSWRVAQERRLRTFFCSSEKELSIAALSPAAPTPPIDPTQSMTGQSAQELPANVAGKPTQMSPIRAADPTARRRICSCAMPTTTRRVVGAGGAATGTVAEGEAGQVKHERDLFGREPGGHGNRGAEVPRSTAPTLNAPSAKIRCSLSARRRAAPSGLTSSGRLGPNTAVWTTPEIGRISTVHLSPRLLGSRYPRRRDGRCTQRTYQFIVTRPGGASPPTWTGHRLRSQ